MFPSTSSAKCEAYVKVGALPTPPSAAQLPRVDGSTTALGDTGVHGGRIGRPKANSSGKGNREAGGYTCPRSIGFREALPVTGADERRKTELRKTRRKGRVKAVNQPALGGPRQVSLGALLVRFYARAT